MPSVSRPYEWSKGTYTYRVVRTDEETIDGKPHTWVGAFVYSHEKDENVSSRIVRQVHMTRVLCITMRAFELFALESLLAWGLY